MSLLMFSKIFGAHKKESTDPKIQIWIKWFTEEPPKQSHIQQLRPDVLDLYSQINESYYTKQQINQQHKVSDEEFFVNLFKLNEPLDEKTKNLVDFLTSNQFNAYRNDKILNIVMTPIMQYTIRYIHQFLDKIDDIVANKKEAIDFAFVGKEILYFIFTLKEERNSDAMYLFGEFYNKLSELMEKGKFIDKFNSEILRITIFYLKLLGNNSPDNVPLYYFVVMHYKFWIDHFHEERFNSDRLNECILICEGMTKIDESYIIMYQNKLINPLLNAGFVMLSLIHVKTNNKVTPKEIAILANSFIKFLIFYTEVDKTFSKSIWTHQFLNFIPGYAMWALDNFPLIEFPEEPEVFCESDLKFFESEKIRPPRMSFIDNVLELNLSRDAMIQNIPDGDQITPYLVMDQVDNRISSVFELSECFKLLSTLFSTAPSKELISTFSDLTLTYVDRLIEHKNTHLTFKHSAELLASSFLFFFIELLLQTPTNMVVEVLKARKDFHKMISTFIFSKKYNTWSTNMERTDNQFFYETRFKVYSLFAKCYANEPSSHITIISALSTIFTSSPTIIDEAIKFTIVLFRTHPENFTKTIVETNFIEAASQYMVDLQQSNIEMIEENYDPGKIQLLRQSRIHIFHFFDMLACIDVLRAQLFSSSTFVRNIMHFFFEDATREYAFDMWKNGLLLDSDFFKDTKISPIMHTFPMQGILLQEAVNHVDDEKWISLIMKYLKMLTEVLPLNKKTLVDWFDKFHTYDDLINLINISTDHDTVISIINTILVIFFYLSQKSPVVRKIICQKPMSVIADKLSTLQFGEETVIRLINLIFERELNMKELPKNIDIHNSKIIPYIHSATVNLKWHETIFRYINQVCSPSVTNKLKIFQSKTPLLIIKYIQTFPEFPEPSLEGEEYRPTVNSLLILFSTVSSAVFKWKTFYEAIKSMKPIQNQRTWWTVQLISAFSTILSEISYKPPSSFFHFDGRHTGIDLPPIPAGSFSKGMTFMIMFELGANWMLDGYKARLLSLVDKSGASLELYFEGKRLAFEYTKGKDKSFKTYIIKTKKDGTTVPFEFKPNVWSRIIFTIDERCNAACYMDKTFLCEFPIKGNYRFDGEIPNGKIACAAQRSTTFSEDPLIANINSIYMFDHCLDIDAIKRLSTLPNDFCFGFSPLQASAFPEIPKELFTEEINQSLLFCYNPRMSSGDTCANFSQRGIGNAKVRGQIIPFSTSFVDVAASMGGIRMFLPIIQYVDYPILNEEFNDATNFLLSLLGVFNQFFQNSNEIIRDFFRSGSSKALAYLLSTVKNESMSCRTINILCEAFYSLRKTRHKLTMIKDIFLNFSLWKSFHPSMFISMLEITWEKIYEVNPGLLKKATNIKTLIFLLVDEENKDLRAAIWEFIRKFSVIQFNESDKQTLYEAAFVNISNDLLLEVLDNINFMLIKKRHNFHKIIEEYNYYTPFVHTTASEDENIRINALKIMFTIFDLQTCGDIEAEGVSSDIMVMDAILLTITLFNAENLTQTTWKYANSLFNELKYQGAAFPLISYLSISYDAELVQQLIDKMCDEFITIEGIRSYQIASAPGWMLWLFNLMLQSKKDEVVLGENEKINEIFAKIIISLMIQKKAAINDFISFMHQIMSYWKVDLTLMMRNVFIIILRLFPQEKLTGEIFQGIFVPIFRFIYFPTDLEVYFRNVQLYDDSEIEDVLAKTVKRPNSIDFVKDPFMQESCTLKQTVFSMRITKEGEWLDKKLAKKLAEWVINSQQQMKEISELKIKTSDAISFIFACIIQTDEKHSNKIPSYINFISPIISGEHSSLSIFGQSLYRLAMNNTPKYGIIFTEFLKNVLKKTDVKDPFNNEIFIAEFNESFRENVAQFLQNLAEKENANAKKCLISSTNAIIATIAAEIEAINPKPFNFLCHNKFQKKYTSFKHEVKIQKMTCEKAWHRIWRELSTNGSPWSSSQNAQHWKSSQRLDSHYRRMFLKPNLEFDNHKIASFNRDAATTKLAQEYYQDWLRTHPEGEIVHETNKEEDLDDLGDEKAQKEYSFTCKGKLVTIAKNYEGTFFMNKREIAFDGVESQSEEAEQQSSKNIQFFIDEVEMVLRRSFLHIDSGLEFFLRNKRSFFVMFNKKSDRDKIVRSLKLWQNQMIIQQTENASNMPAFQELINQWKQGAISNFDYLMKVNLFAGRSLNDLSQYPVFPWILNDYESETLDINDPSIYRDLSKPIGALNEQRLKSCLSDYENCPESPEKCLYRMHYSNAFYVLSYLVRMEPFTTLHIDVNDKKFDKSNRMFIGIGRAWKAVTSRLPDYRELIPEFYSTPEFLLNSNDFDLGFNDDGVKIGDVVLPKWAKSAEDFIAKHRRCFESKYVSEHLNEWIDLIFGFKQQGPAAVAANNTFHQFCYRSTITKEVLEDPDMLQTIQYTAGNVGIIPSQIFAYQHPKRDPQSIPNVDISIGKGTVLFAPQNEITFLVPTSRNSLLTLTANSQVCTVNFNTSIYSRANNTEEEPNLTEIGNISEFSFLRGSSEKSFAFFSETSKLVVSSPWDSCFHVFKYEGNQLHYIFTERQKSALIHSIYCISRNALLTTWRDSSISLYTLENPEQLYRITPHHASIVDADALYSLDLIASVDKDGVIVLSRLSTGSYIRSFQANGVPQKILLIELGFIVVASYEKDGTTKIISYSISTKEVASITVIGSVLSWTRVGTDFNQMVTMSLDTQVLISMKIPNLEMVNKYNLESNITTINYEPTIKGVVGKDLESKIFYFQVI